MLEAFGAIIHRRRWLVLGLSALFLVGSIAVLLQGGVLTGGTIQSLESEAAQRLVEEVVGHPEDNSFVAVFRSADLDARDEAFGAALREALDPVRTDPRVLSVMTSDEAPPFFAPGMVNGPAHEAFVVITLRGDFKQGLRDYPQVRALLRSDRFTITCTGRLPYMNDLDATLEHDLQRAELLSFPLALLILLAVFRTAVAAALPVGVGGLAVAGGIAVILALSRVTDIAQYTVNVCSLVGLGVAIDYSLFTVSRYREELAAGRGYAEALSRSLATAGRVVAFSGAAVATGLVGLLFFEGSYLSAMGMGGAIVVALAVVFALTFLPALLAILGPRIHAGRLPLPSVRRTEGAWHRVALAVMRRPLLVLVPTLALLLVMGVPFLHLRVATADARVLTSEAEARRGYEIMRTDFADEARNRILLVVRFPTAPALTTERIGALYDLSRRVGAMPGVTKVESLVDGDQPMGKEDYQTILLEPPSLYASLVESAKKYTVGERTVLLYARTEALPESEEARAIVRAVRSDRRVGDGALVVGGATAFDLDTTQFILSHAPRAVGFVVGVTVIVLTLMLGSVVLPLKAVAMNFVSIAGSFGALVWIFQDGHLWVSDPRPVEPSIPVILFCMLFGLSMDYEVLMLSRIKEAYALKGDNTQAVAEGLEKTAGLVTSAAAIMVAVFGAFAIARIVLLQAVGFGMALAVALDATLVRVLLVPATMRLFGNANWWAPRPLRTLRSLLGFDGATSR